MTAAKNKRSYSNTKMVMFIFHILRGTKFERQVLQTMGSTGIIARYLSLTNQIGKIENQSVYLLALTLSFIIKLFRRVYHMKRRKALSEFDHLPRKKWKNDYPIILVHGFGGFTPDESFFFGDYFGYASDPDIQGAPHNLVYHADLSPWASLHDRACELYQ